MPGATVGELAAEERLLNEPLYQALRPRVVEFISRVRAATTADDWVQLHRDLLIDFGARQDAADEVLPAAKTETAREIANALHKAIDHVINLNRANPAQIKDRRVVVFEDEAETWEQTQSA